MNVEVEPADSDQVDDAAHDAVRDEPGKDEPEKEARRHRHTSQRSLWESLDANSMGLFWILAASALVLQLIALILYSNHLYDRFDVSTDFAHNAQAWYLISHGDLSPVDTVRLITTPFWRDHFDLIIWVLSPLRWIWPQPIILLWVQDVAIVATEAITLLWMAAIFVEGLRSRRNLAGSIALVALLANPWWYETVSFDIHMPPLGAPFLVLAGYSFWKGKYRRALISCAICLLFGAVVAELVLVVAVAAICTRRVRRSGGTKWALVTAAIGVVWFGLINALGANQASNLATNYGYLSSTSSHIGLSKIFRGAISHPSRVYNMLRSRKNALLRELVPTGFLGLITPWGFFFFVGLLLVTALTYSDAYSSTAGSFQNLPAMPFIFIGTVMVLVKIASFPRQKEPKSTETETGAEPETETGIETGTDQEISIGRRRDVRESSLRRIVARVAPPLALVLALAGTVGAVVQGEMLVRGIPSKWLLVSDNQATALKQAIDVIPSDAEVVASYGVIGRFSQRKYIYELAGPEQFFPIQARNVYFVITPKAGYETLDQADAIADVHFIQVRLGAKILVASHGVWLLQWEPPGYQKRVFIPGIRGSNSLCRQC